MPTKKLFQNCALLFCFILSACTLHFKGKDLEIDTETKGPQIGNLPKTNHTFELAMVDIFKDAVLAPSDTPR